MPGENIPDEGVEAIQTADDFDAAYKEAVTASEKGVEKTQKVEGDKPKEDKQEPERKDVKDEKVEGVKTSDNIPVEDDKKKEPDVNQQYKSLQGMYTQLLNEVKELREVKKEEPVKPPPKKEPEDTSALFKSFYDTLFTDLDDVAKKTIKEYDEEFDSISKVENIKREHALRKIINLVEERQDKKISEFAKAMKDVIQPLFDTVERTSQSEHYNQIKVAHKDFETFRDNGQLMSWIDEQPKFLKDSYMKVYKSGETQDVIDMYTRFKMEKGLLETSDNANGDGKKRTDERMKNLETVKSRTSGVNIGSTGKAEDFDSAYDEALAKSKRR